MSVYLCDCVRVLVCVCMCTATYHGVHLSRECLFVCVAAHTERAYIEAKLFAAGRSRVHHWPAFDHLRWPGPVSNQIQIFNSLLHSNEHTQNILLWPLLHTVLLKYAHARVSANMGIYADTMIMPFITRSAYYTARMHLLGGFLCRPKKR